MGQGQYWGFVTNAHKIMAPDLFQKFLQALGPAHQPLQRPQVIGQEDRLQHLPLPKARDAQQIPDPSFRFPRLHLHPLVYRSGRGQRETPGT